MSCSKIFRLLLLSVCAALYCGTVLADDTIVKEDFTGTTTTNSWYFFNGACLTASSTKSAASTSPGSPPGCVGDSYYSSNFPNEKLVGGFNGKSGSTLTLPDPDGNGALRFTNGCNWNGSNCNNGGHNQNGAIIWGGTPISTSSGLDITFKTMTYRGDSLSNGSTNTSTYQPARNDGADGMSFFLMDSSAVPNIGSYGGSLGYSCSNGNYRETEPYHGMVGAYLGLGIDEWGNFLNGTNNNFNAQGITTSHLGDNTSTGAGQWSNRIGLRGGGSVAWSALSTTYADILPSSFANWATTYTSACAVTNSSGSCIQYVSYADESVAHTCASGYLEDYSGNKLKDSNGNAVSVPDYAAIAYYNLPQKINGVPVVLANEYSSGGYSSQKATPITYHLKITNDAKLSLEMSINGGSYTSIIQNKDISSLAGESMPSSVRFGFAGSTGGSSNIHEVLCFREEPLSEAASSTTVNQQQSSKVINKEGAQAYFGYFDPTDWSGRLTANTLSTDASGNLLISALANWDASCVLTGTGTAGCANTGASGPTSAQPWQTSSTGGRVILTWNGTAGVPFEWTSLTTGTNSQQSALDGTDGLGSDRVDFLRGYRNKEVQPDGSGEFRDRDSVLGDIMDSSSAWVGPPSKSVYTAYETPGTWKDRIPGDTSGDSMSENSGQTYQQYASSTAANRLNVVYVGANDGMLHGFRAGSFTDLAAKTYDNSTNDGQEVLAFMPAGVLQAIHSTTAEDDYSGLNYSHAFSVDATPGASDLFYGGTWHTWLVGGLGEGGAEIYALDVTDPSAFTESNASGVVKGDWTPSTLSCSGNSSCGNNLGYTFGTPEIRRLHNGDWAIIFGNGLPTSTSSGDAGIFIITLDSSGKPSTEYYLSTGVSGGNGIAYAHPADLDGDHIVDYVYAGDLKGNVWRFDLTSSDSSKWAVTPGPIFTTSSGQPITSDVYPVKVSSPSGTTLMMLYFGTGQKFPLTYSSPTTYQTGTQSIYGVWDWNMSNWDALNSAQYASLKGDDGTTTGDTVKNITSLSAPYTLTPSNLVLQGPMATDSAGNRTISSTNLHTICWAGATACGSAITSNANFGWYVNLPGSNSGDGITTNEQIVYNPQLISTAIQFNSILPAVDSPLDCSPDTDSGWSYAFDVLSGGPVNSGSVNFFNNGNTSTIGIKTDASGTSSVVTTTNTSDGSTEYWMIYQSTHGGAGPPQNIIPPSNISGYRETWVQLR